MTIHAAYACDQAYAVQTAVSMASLCENNRSEQIVLYLITDGIALESLNGIQTLVEQTYRQKLEIIPIGQLIGHLAIDVQGRHPRTVYAKLFLEEVCPSDRILYLDSDTIVAAPLAGLLSVCMEDAYIAGVKMPYTDKKKAGMGILPGIPYLCDGVLLLNLKKWRSDHMKDRCSEYIRSSLGHPPMLSEGTINYAAKGLVKVLPPEYNLMSGMLLWDAKQLAQLYRVSDYYTEDELLYARKHPVIVHYLNELYIRPWYKNSDHPYRELYLAYCSRPGFDSMCKMRTGSIKVRTWMLRMLNRFLPFCIFQKIYHMVKG